MARSTVYNNITSEDKIGKINSENISLMNEFLDYLSSIDRSPQTIKGYKSDLLIFFTWCMEQCNNKFFIKLTKREIAKFQNYAINDWGWSPKRMRRVKSTVSSLSNYIENILDEDEEFAGYRSIVKKIESPANESVREKTVLSDEQVQLLLDTLVERKEYERACAVAIAAFSGMRKAELLLMKMEYFIPERIVYGCLYKTDKIRTKGHGRAGKPLNKYIMNKVDMYFNLWKQERERLGIDSEWVFVSKQNGVYEHRKTLDGWTDEFSEIVGEDFYFHAERHYTCTIMLNDYNLPPEVVKEFFGWSDISLLKIYNDKSAIDNFDKYFTANGIVKQEGNNGLSDLGK